MWAEDLRPHDRGRQFDVVAEASVDGEVVWRDVSTLPAPGAERLVEGRRAIRAALRPNAVWRLPGDIGRRYAGVSGDNNPIHTHPLLAKALGQPGTIAHGMWTKARSLAALEGTLPEAYTVDVRFKLPLRIPGRATLLDRRTARSPSTTRAAARTSRARSAEPALADLRARGLASSPAPRSRACA